MSCSVSNVQSLSTGMLHSYQEDKVLQVGPPTYIGLNIMSVR